MPISRPVSSYGSPREDRSFQVNTEMERNRKKNANPGVRGGEYHHASLTLSLAGALTGKVTSQTKFREACSAKPTKCFGNADTRVSGTFWYPSGGVREWYTNRYDIHAGSTRSAMTDWRFSMLHLVPSPTATAIYSWAGMSNGRIWTHDQIRYRNAPVRTKQLVVSSSVSSSSFEVAHS